MAFRNLGRRPLQGVYAGTLCLLLAFRQSLEDIREEIHHPYAYDEDTCLVAELIVTVCSLDETQILQSICPEGILISTPEKLVITHSDGVQLLNRLYKRLRDAASPEYRRKYGRVERQLLIRLATQLDALPTSLAIRDLKFNAAAPSLGGAVTDIFVGHCEGASVSVKRLRKPEIEDEQDTYAVRRLHLHFCPCCNIYTGLHGSMPHLEPAVSSADSAVCRRVGACSFSR